MNFAFIIDPEDSNGYVIAVGTGVTREDAQDDLLRQADMGIGYNTYSRGSGTLITADVTTLIDDGYLVIHGDDFEDDEDEDDGGDGDFVIQYLEK